MRVCKFVFVHTSSCNFTDDVWTKKIFSSFSYKLVQISPIMILVNSGAFLSISSWCCELTELIFGKGLWVICLTIVTHHALKRFSHDLL